MSASRTNEGPVLVEHFINKKRSHFEIEKDLDENKIKMIRTNSFTLPETDDFYLDDLSLHTLYIDELLFNIYLSFDL